MKHYFGMHDERNIHTAYDYQRVYGPPRIVDFIVFWLCLICVVLFTFYVSCKIFHAIFYTDSRIQWKNESYGAVPPQMILAYQYGPNADIENSNQRSPKSRRRSTPAVARPFHSSTPAPKAQRKRTCSRSQAANQPTRTRTDH